SMVRAAAKNHKYVTVVVNPNNYPEIISRLKTDTMDYHMRLDLAMEAFTHTAEYDTYISKYLQKICEKEAKFPSVSLLIGEKIQDLRYGENPHQEAAFYRIPNSCGASVGTAKQLQGKELSFNNIIDINAALELVREFPQPSAVIVKHTNPCGTALGDNICQAYLRALEADPISAFGGIVGLNREVDEDVASEMVKLFLEAIIAPSFSAKALSILSAKTNLRLLETGPLLGDTGGMDIKKVNGGFLIQDIDKGSIKEEDLRVVSKRHPDSHEMEELLFAWRVVKHVKSNAIVVTKDRQTIGVGAGQMNRVGSAEIAFAQGGDKCQGAVLASDAYFPFRDTIDAAAKAGIKAVIQPGGSIRDAESIEAANEHGIAMVFTGMRHFKH
ncbi:MAG: bifunctional phosphoribosylaminoimidazolecarboxamide formyltransferase/IMP cyclohydrolase, partial [Clostridiales bacterium]